MRRRRPTSRASRGTPRQHGIDTVLTDSLTQRWRKYLGELRRCRRHCSEEAVHDLRVATRRLISTLMLVEIVLPDPRLRRMRRRLKRLFDSLSPLRDTQVQLLALEPHLQRYPELETLITTLKVRERTLLKDVATRIRKLQTAQMSRTLASVRKSLREHLSGRTLKKAARHAALGAAANRFVAATLQKKRVAAGRPRTIHRARVAFKKLRYTMEALAPLLPSLTKTHLQAMDAYQTRMGIIQDAEVLDRLVGNFALRTPVAVRRKLSPFRRELLAHKRELIRLYAIRADELAGFWRPLRSFSTNNLPH